MTDKPDRDGILDPRASEPVALPSEIEAFDRWAAEPDNLAAWEAARRWLAHAAGDVDEALDVARTALLLAPDGPERERARQRAPRPAGRPAAPGGVCPLPAGREHHRPAAAPHPESRRDVRRSPGRGGGLPAERRGRGRQVHAGHHAGPGRGLWRGAGRPRRGRRDGQGVLRPVRRAAGARDGGQLRGSRRSLGLASA